MSLRLDWCSHEAAKFAVEHWHYSRTFIRAKAAKVGVWEDEQFIGAVVFGSGIGASGKALGLTEFQVAELCRVALRRHRAPVSRIVSIAIRLLHKEMPGLRLLVSYADPAQDHHGGIYQAMGWTYVGRTAPDFEVVDPNGKRWHSRHVSKTGVKVHFGKPMRVIRPDEGVRVSLPGKHKYLYPLDDEMRARIAPLAKPYPKRARSIGSDAPGDQPGEGGATPTRALQNTEAAGG